MPYRGILEHSGQPPNPDQQTIRNMPVKEQRNRFLVSCPEPEDEHTFLTYGDNFARQLNLPETPDQRVLVANQIPPHRRAVFIRSGHEAVLSGVPVDLDDTLEREAGRVGQHRAAFVRIGVCRNALANLVHAALGRRGVDNRIGARPDRDRTNPPALSIGADRTEPLCDPLLARAGGTSVRTTVRLADCGDTRSARPAGTRFAVGSAQGGIWTAHRHSAVCTMPPSEAGRPPSKRASAGLPHTGDKPGGRSRDQPRRA